MPGCPDEESFADMTTDIDEKSGIEGSERTSADEGAGSSNDAMHVPIHYLPKTQTGITVAAVLIAIGLLLAFFIVHHRRASHDSALAGELDVLESRPVPLDVVEVTRASSRGILMLPGDARPFYETTIFARTSGYVSKWFVDIGDRVKEGQELASIETPELDDQLHESNAKLAQLNAEANVASTNAQFAKISYDRWQAAAPEGAVSAQERDEKKAELDSALAQLQASKAAVNLGEATVQRLRTLEGFKQVTAPFEGVITKRFVDIGALVTAGSTTNTTPLYTIAQSNQIRVFVDVPQASAPDIKVGMAGRATARELPGEVFCGVVDRTAGAIDEQSRTLKVELLVPNPKLTLLPGMYVEVKFESSRVDPPLRIPAAALSFGPTGPQVAKISDDGRLTVCPVTISRDMGDSVEIGTGLSDGDRVALNAGSQVSEGEKVDAHLIAWNPAPPNAAPAHAGAAPTIVSKIR